MAGHHHHHHPLPLRTAAHSGPLCCQASWCKTAGVGGRECWMMRPEGRGVGRVGERERERARKAVRQSKAPHSDSQQRSMWLHLLNGLMISRPRLCVLGTLRAQPENHRFVWRRAADMPKSPSCYGRGSGTERNGSSPRKKGCVKKEQFSIQFKLCQ